MQIPELEPHCGSWVIVDRATGNPIAETFRRKIVGAVDQEKFEVVTTAQWLARVNRKIREAHHVGK
jgi:hypothetical protein